MTLLEWLSVVNAVGTAAVILALFLFRTGRAIGARDATVDVKLEQVDRVNARLDEIRAFITEAGKRMSDKVTELQGFLGKAELLLRDVSELQRDNDKIGEMVGGLRERIASCEAVQKEQAAQRWKETTR